MKMLLARTESQEQGTFGLLIHGDLQLHTAELPWRDNARSISCVPEGVYTCKRIISPKFGNTFEIMDVPGRTHILFHAGNFAGNEDLGFKTDSDGCVLPGLYKSSLNNQKVVLSSRAAFSQLMEHLVDEDEFQLTITNVDIW